MAIIVVLGLIFLTVMSDTSAHASRNESTIITWAEIPGTMAHVSTSINYNWGVAHDKKIYICTRPCTGQWKLITGLSKQVDVSDMEVWSISTSDQAYKRPVDGSGAWVRVSTLYFKHLSASGNGYIWSINRNNDVYKCKKPCTGAWTNVPGKLKQIDGGERYVFGVSNDNKVFRRPVNGGGLTGNWLYIANKKMKYVSVGADYVYGVEASSGHVYQCALPCTEGDWVVAESCFKIKQIEAAVDELISTTQAGTIFKREV